MTDKVIDVENHPNSKLIITEKQMNERLQAWKEEFELLYMLSKEDSFEALEECMRLVIRLNGMPKFFGDEVLVKDRG